jgi:hypothetical protein
METLGCTARLLWTEIFSHIEDVVSSRQNKKGIIMCKNFHTIHSELLDTFYSYMQRNNKIQNIYFYIISESVSFIPDNIINCSQLINIARPTITQYNKCLHSKLKKGAIIENIKELKCNIIKTNKYDLLSTCLYNNIIDTDELKYTSFRDILYDILIYDYNIGRLLFTLLSDLYTHESIGNNDEKKYKIYNVICSFLKNYNNNYRPIYHLELLMFNIISIIHGL